MKKIISILVLFAAVVLMVGCGEGQGDFPEINENNQVEMTAEEVTTLLSAVNMETETEEAMMLSIDLEISAVNEMMDFWSDTKFAETSIEGTISSKTYMFMHDDITEVKMLSENEIDLNVSTTYVNDSSLDEEDSLKGSLNTYFTDQYLYYDADLESSTEVLENGKYKMNLGITQTMWDELFTNPEDLLDDYVDAGIDIDQAISDSEMIAVMLDAEMLKVYQSGGETTVYIDITKQGILDHAYDILDAMYDTTDWSNDDYVENKINEFEMPLEMFTAFELEVAFVIEDDKMTKMGYQFNISGEEDGMSIDITGTMVFDMFVEMPKMPNDLDDYELTEFPLDMF